jgi:hypothetical protein
MKKTILYISILSSGHFIYFIDVELIIQHGTYFLSNAFQEGTNLLNTFTNNSYIHIPKFKEAFDISKPTFLDVAKTTSDGISSTWDSIINNPRPILYSGPKLHFYNIPFLGLSLAVLNITVNYGLGYAETVWGGFSGIISILQKNLTKFIYNIYNGIKKMFCDLKLTNKKKYLNKINKKNNICSFKTKSYFDTTLNNEYINRVVDNSQRDFLVYSSSVDNNELSQDDNNNDINNSVFTEINNDNIVNNNSEASSINITIENIGNLNIGNVVVYTDEYMQEVIQGNGITFLDSTVIPHLINNLVGTSILFDWNGSNLIIYMNNMPSETVVYPSDRGDSADDSYTSLSDSYLLGESLQFTAHFGPNTVATTFPGADNILHLNIYNIGANNRGLFFFILFLHSAMEDNIIGYSTLVQGGRDVVMYSFNGYEVSTWTVSDINELNESFPDFITQLNRRFIVLHILQLILIQYDPDHEYLTIDGFNWPGLD